jgi:hypothetical protein
MNAVIPSRAEANWGSQRGNPERLASTRAALAADVQSSTASRMTYRCHKILALIQSVEFPGVLEDDLFLDL